jgi:hypothetical protein
MRGMLVLAVCLGCWAATGLAIGAPFAEIEGQLSVDTTESGVATLAITKLYRLVEGFTFEESSIVVNCPAPGAEAWKYTLAVGDTLELAYRIVTERKRGLVLRQGRGATGEISMPAGGWARTCACPQLPGTLEARMYGVFLDADRQSVPLLAVSGRDANAFFSRFLLLPGKYPDAPSTVRLLLSWDRGNARQSATLAAGGR